MDSQSRLHPSAKMFVISRCTLVGGQNCGDLRGRGRAAGPALGLSRRPESQPPVWMPAAATAARPRCNKGDCENSSDWSSQ